MKVCLLLNIYVKIIELNCVFLENKCQRLSLEICTTKSLFKDDLEVGHDTKQNSSVSLFWFASHQLENAAIESDSLIGIGLTVDFFLAQVYLPHH